MSVFPKVGDEYHRLCIDEEEGDYEWDLFVVRTVRGGKATAIQKNFCTWGKRSKKHGDFGWLDSIDQMWRHSWYFDVTGDKEWRKNDPWNLHRTKLQALRYTMKKHREYIKEGWYEGDNKAAEKMTNKLKAIEKRLKR